MTIGGWVGFIFICLLIGGATIAVAAFNSDRAYVGMIAAVVAILMCIGAFCGFKWYYTSTASGIRALTDERSELRNGLERTITVYTANGDKIAEYKGKIDLEMDQDYIKFDWNGRRYIYYNCFVETIAEIP